MQWPNGRRLFAVVLLAVFSLLLPSFVSGDQVFMVTEAEMARLEMVFNGLQTENEGLKTDLNELRQSYAEARTLLAESRQELREANNSLTKAATSFEESVKATAETLSTVRTDAIIWKVVSGVFAAATLYLAVK